MLVKSEQEGNKGDNSVYLLVKINANKNGKLDVSKKPYKDKHFPNLILLFYGCHFCDLLH